MKQRQEVMMTKRFRFGGEELFKRGDEVKVFGEEHGQAELVELTDAAMVVKFAGWSYNPGSRFSGLRNYAPACTVVYVPNVDNDLRGSVAVEVAGRRCGLRWRALVEWNNREATK